MTSGGVRALVRQLPNRLSIHLHLLLHRLGARLKVEPALVKHFHSLYYGDRKRTWNNTFFLGVPVAKCPLDLWVYHELIHELRPDLIIECGTFVGGSALFLASMCDLVKHGKVISIDLEPRPSLPHHDRIQYLVGSSTAPDVMEQVRRLIDGDGHVLVILDSDHHKEHVLRELRLYSQFVTRGSYLIVEDTNLNGHPVAPHFGPGPMEAVQDFLQEQPEFTIDRTREKFFLTFNPHGYLKRVSGKPARGMPAQAELSASTSE